MAGGDEPLRIGIAGTSSAQWRRRAFVGVFGFGDLTAGRQARDRLGRRDHRVSGARSASSACRRGCPGSFADELDSSWARIQTRVGQNCPELSLDGMFVEKMTPRGVELIIGGRNDPHWGPILMIGSGGVQAEILRDLRLLPPELTKSEIVQELYQLRCAKLLQGFRGEPPADVAAVADLIARLARLMSAEPAIRELDLNPVVVHPQGQGATALDALLLVEH